MAMGVPGCPELACCTASIASVRMVLILRVSRSVVGMTRGRRRPCQLTADPSKRRTPDAVRRSIVRVRTTPQNSTVSCGTTTMSIAEGAAHAPLHGSDESVAQPCDQGSGMTPSGSQGRRKGEDRGSARRERRESLADCGKLTEWADEVSPLVRRDQNTTTW